MKARRNLARHEGHLLRRVIHISVGIIPFIYYWYGNTILSWLHIRIQTLIIAMIIIVALMEGVRLSRNWIIFGQRQYESKTISSIAWTFVSVGLVVLFTPKIGPHGAGYGVPLIWSLCLGDPIMGEARILNLPTYIVIISGLIIVSLVWLLSAYFLGAPWWIIPLIVPITVLSELINLSWIDDNATMLLIPLAVILIF